MNKNLVEEIARVNTLTNEQIFSRLEHIYELTELVTNFSDFRIFAKLINERLVPILVEMEVEYTNSFAFIFGCLSDYLNEETGYQLTVRGRKLPSDWGKLAAALVNAMMQQE